MRNKGFDPIALAAATEAVVVDGARRKYVQLGRPLRFYGGTTSATEVGCNLRCKFCFSDKPVWKPQKTGKFYTPQQVFDGLAKSARKHGHKIISASASEGTIGREHLMQLLDLVEESEFVYVLETNGMILGNNPEYAQALAKYKKLHVRVSIKGDNPELYHELTGANPDSYELPYKAIANLIDAGVSCNACLMSSFSDEEGINRVKRKLIDVHPGILKSLEIERITMFPKVTERLSKKGLKPINAQRRRYMRG
ncbi:radical SAM protein [Rhodospirillales bacterium]|nr:radical SAM protein [Rhodospirillales bacterium]